MKKKLFVCFLGFSIFLIGCGEKKEEVVKKTLSCSNETHLFHSKKLVEHHLTLDQNQKLLEYEYVEKYFEFDDDNDFNMICEGAPEEAENNNKIYPYIKETANCDKEKKEVTIRDFYDVSKLESKQKLQSEELRNALDDNYVLDSNTYKESFTKKGYTCEER